MSDTPVVQPNEPSESDRNILLVAYILYAGIVISGPLLPIAGVIINHLKVNETHNGFLRSHHRWLLRTFWWSLLWSVLISLLYFTVVLIPVGLLGHGALAIWYIYRVVRGALSFADRAPMPV